MIQSKKMFFYYHHSYHYYYYELIFIMVIHLDIDSKIMIKMMMIIIMKFALIRTLKIHKNLKCKAQVYSKIFICFYFQKKYLYQKTSNFNTIINTIIFNLLPIYQEFDIIHE